MAKTIPQLTDATSVNAADEMIIQQGGITKRTTGAELAKGLNTINSTINVRDFGAVGDGVTNDYTAFVSAMAASSGRTLFVPAGTYSIAFTGGTAAFAPPLNIRICGEGRQSTILNFAPTNVDGSTFFNIDFSGFALRDLTITTAMPSTRWAAMFNWRASNMSVENCILDGAMTHSGATTSHQVYGFVSPSTGTQDAFLLQNCRVTRLGFPFLKANDRTSTQTNIKICGNHFTGNYYNDCGLNSPNGVCDDVHIINNTFENNQTIDSVGPTQALGVALASVTNAVVSGNSFSGKYTHALHIEEACKSVSAVGNVFDITVGACVSFNANSIGQTPASITAASWSSGVATITTAANHGYSAFQSVSITGVNPAGYNSGYVIVTEVVSATQFKYLRSSDPGAYVSGGTTVKQAAPQHCAIVGNTMIQSGAAKLAGTMGIRFIFNTLSGLPASNIIVSGNTINNFESGIYSVATLDDTIVVKDNLIDKCTYGIQVSDGGLTFSGNTTRDCDNDILGVISAGLAYESFTVSDHTFVNSTVPVTSTDTGVALIDPSFIFSEFNHTASNTYKVVCPATANDRHYGTACTTIMSSDSFDRSFDAAELTWNGTSFTETTKVSRDSGWAIAYRVNAGNLEINCFNANNRIGARLQMAFRGTVYID